MRLRGRSLRHWRRKRLVRYTAHVLLEFLVLLPPPPLAVVATGAIEASSRSRV